MTTRSTIEALQPLHLRRLRAFGRRSCLELTAAPWPGGPRSPSRLPFWTLLSYALSQSTGHHRAWVHRGEQGIDGLVVARLRCDGLVWDVQRLWSGGEHEGVARDLLLCVSEEAAARGARRVFLEVRPSSAGLAVARSAGFDHYTWATWYLGRSPAQPPRVRPSGRPRRGSDEHALFQLYKAAVPAPVRAAEAMTLDEWVHLHRGARPWAAGLHSSPAQYMWEDDQAAVAWLELAPTARTWHAEVLVHPAHEDLCDAVIARALLQANQRTLYVTCREYQQPLASALERAQFVPVGRRAVCARQLAARIPEPRLVPARAGPTLGG